ncbi:hypothetical protein DAEQUDRAFT_732606 [Daedalea quercina L-15889]|uniref:Uncharacterized protein n=1 Tax=Daedalea quercina L-15889 TaxID=1314783 RepID=A0A165LII2_9APHY|nr:hypothetical protein DAEQUDRAFT_732606 [Daedalea quercina L-15889]
MPSMKMHVVFAILALSAWLLLSNAFDFPFGDPFGGHPIYCGIRESLMNTIPSEACSSIVRQVT